jgi:hypothetical protein
MSCSCPVFTQSDAICKHIFLINYVTGSPLSFKNTIVPCHWPHEEDNISLLDQRAEKHHMISQLHKNNTACEANIIWQQTTEDEKLDSISREDLAHCLSLSNTYKHLLRDTLLGRPDYAKQWS